MITKEQLKMLRGKRVAAVLTHKYKAPLLDYPLPIGTIVEIDIIEPHICDLYVSDRLVDWLFPNAAATLLDAP